MARQTPGWSANRKLSRNELGEISSKPTSGPENSGLPMTRPEYHSVIL
jgi:hypothetical protein